MGRCLNFYPRSPCGERRSGVASVAAMAYFYPRSPCGERLMRILLYVQEVQISIHALLAESDGGALRTPPHTTGFLSTLSLRRATGGLDAYCEYITISIHALLAESDCVCQHYGVRFGISIHALLAESDLRRAIMQSHQARQFLSTLSLRRATVPAF